MSQDRSIILKILSLKNQVRFNDSDIALCGRNFADCYSFVFLSFASVMTYVFTTVFTSLRSCLSFLLSPGMRHASELANMALDLIEGAKIFEIPHRPDKSLLIRAGINSGPCVAGTSSCLSPHVVPLTTRPASHYMLSLTTHGILRPPSLHVPPAANRNVLVSARSLSTATCRKSQSKIVLQGTFPRLPTTLFCRRPNL